MSLLRVACVSVRKNCIRIGILQKKEMRFTQSLAAAAGAALWTGQAAACFQVSPQRQYSSLPSTQQAMISISLLVREQRRMFTSTRIVKCGASQDRDVDVGSDDLLSTFATDYHAPVMVRECVDALLQCERNVNRQRQQQKDTDRGLILVDATLGGGGHSAAILERLQEGDVLIGCDVDPNALETASKRLQPYMISGENLPRFVSVQTNFGDLTTALQQVEHPFTKQPISQVDGILLDLGVSSHQINTAERGFAFMKEGPLDMRMGSGNNEGLTAADICNEFDESELKRIFKWYGDEPRAAKVAKSIVQHRPLHTTTDLVEAISAVTPNFVKKSRRMGRTATLARVFQSLRIVVNQEDNVLEKVLEEVCPTLVRPGGRLVVLSYHSMEDRAAKRVIRSGSIKRSGKVRDDERDVYGNYIGTPRPWKAVGKRRKASEQEVEINTRARSAMLRVAERMDTTTAT